ncbi:MAG: hypothetical protein Q8N31_11280 [Reyranella sp.]|nr:hypothetical protein [Reyranella sp.]MDP3160591.1 hypothetical protein [Reyranella sp.]
MENWGIALGIAVVVGVGAYFYSKKATRTGRLGQALAAVVAAVLAAVLANAGMKYLRDSGSLAILSDQPAAVDQAMQTIRESPLLGLVLKENPALDARFREALEAELRTPAKAGPPRSFLIGAEVRRDIIAPTLRRADDASALAAINSMQAFVKHLQDTNVALCRDFGLLGIQQPGRLDAKAATLFKHALTAQEAAYVNGKARPAAPQQITNQEVHRLLEEAGYTTADFDRLAALTKSSNEEGCAATVKLYQAPTLLPPERGGTLARYLLTVAS